MKNLIKEIMIEVLKKTQERYNFEMISYTIMDNHFHFIIRTLEDGETISRIMQYIKARFAEKYNKLHKRTGPFWNERFTDIIIDKTKNPPYFLNWLLWYLGFNPVRKRMVQDPRDYKYGAINCYLDENFSSPIKITYHEHYISLGRSFKERLKNFLKYEEAHRKKYAYIFA